MRCARPVGCAMAVWLAVVTAPAAQQPQFRADTHTVSVYATVTDALGRLVPNLTAADFELYDNGVRQPITLFASTAQPLSTVLLIDRSSSVEPHFPRVAEAAREFVSQLRPDDRARVGSFSARIQIEPADFTSDRNSLLQLLDQPLPEGGPTPLWAAMQAAITALAAAPPRRVILVFSDGKDSASPDDALAALQDVKARTQQHDVMVYGVGLAITCPTDGPLAQATSSPRVTGAADRVAWMQQGRGRGRVRLPPTPPVLLPPRLPPRAPGMPPRGPTDPFGRPIERDDDNDRPTCKPSSPDPGLRDLAALHGGGYFELSRSDDLRATFSRVADELRQQYLLAFPAATDGRVHQLDVRVRRPDLMVRARRSYLAPPK